MVIRVRHARAGSACRRRASTTCLLQTELETIALRETGEVAWRAAHSDVITDAQLVAGRLDLTTYGGQHVYLDARTGQPA